MQLIALPALILLALAPLPALSIPTPVAHAAAEAAENRSVAHHAKRILLESEIFGILADDQNAREVGEFVTERTGLPCGLNSEMAIRAGLVDKRDFLHDLEAVVEGAMEVGEAATEAAGKRSVPHDARLKTVWKQLIEDIYDHDGDHFTRDSLDGIDFDPWPVNGESIEGVVTPRSGNKRDVLDVIEDIAVVALDIV